LTAFANALVLKRRMPSHADGGGDSRGIGSVDP
jgi:hypothetical protein